jgi:hypothetical protein
MKPPIVTRIHACVTANLVANLLDRKHRGLKTSFVGQKVTNNNNKIGRTF